MAPILRESKDCVGAIEADGGFAHEYLLRPRKGITRTHTNCGDSSCPEPGPGVLGNGALASLETRTPELRFSVAARKRLMGAIPGACNRSWLLLAVQGASVQRSAPSGRQGLEKLCRPFPSSQ